jgi:hypothetical protein
VSEYSVPRHVHGGAVWRGSFGVVWSPVNQAYFALYSPGHDVRTASVLGVDPSVRVVEALAGFPARVRRSRHRRSR